jgi:hypothetical protein
MDHVVYLDARANELEKLLDNRKSMIIRGAMGRKLPYGRVNVDDVLYFINNNAEGIIRAKGVVSSVINSEKMGKEESFALLEKYQNKLQLTDTQFQRWGGKRYIVLIEVTNIQKIKPFALNKSEYRTMDDWFIVEKIENVRS